MVIIMQKGLRVIKLDIPRELYESLIEDANKKEMVLDDYIRSLIRASIGKNHKSL